MMQPKEWLAQLHKMCGPHAIGGHVAGVPSDTWFREWIAHIQQDAVKSTMKEEHKIMALRAHLDKAAKQFRFYELQHTAKGTPESNIKADVNADLAEELELVLEETK